ncbi:MAG: nucleotide exchange factor GrpE [Bacillota bacterium]|nr:nucleotide exchange factor GrpE [Bacillota bacterium]
MLKNRSKSNSSDELDNMDNSDENTVSNDCEDSQPVTEESENGNNELENQLKELTLQLDEKSKKCDEYLNMLQRSAAEFDNYKKRTSKEKESLYSEAVSDTVLAFLPVVDNMERAVKACNEKGDDEKSINEGFELVFRQLGDVLKKLGVEAIKSVGEQFDPQVHNAVMHMEDEAHGSNEVVEEFQKGYMLEEKVIRHSMVKVAN